MALLTTIILPPLLLLLLSAALTTEVARAVGPELKARARLLRDLSLLSGLQRPPSEEEAEGDETEAGGRGRRRRRTLIDMSLAVRSLDLDMDKGIFKVDGWMSLRWQDRRYSWDPADYGGVEAVALPFSRLWAPEVILHNSAEEKFIYRQVGMARHHGEIAYLVAVHARSLCRPNFDGFPFGMQACRLVFGSWVNEGYNVEYRVGENETVALDDFSSPTGWKVVAAKAGLESRQFPLFEEPTHTVVFDFAFKRDSYFDGAAGRMVREGERLQHPGERVDF